MSHVLSVVILGSRPRQTHVFNFAQGAAHPIAGKAMLRHVVDAAEKLQPGLLCIVYGHGGEQVQTAMADVKAEWHCKRNNLGTAMPYVRLCLCCRQEV